MLEFIQKVWIWKFLASAGFKFFAMVKVMRQIKEKKQPQAISFSCMVLILPLWKEGEGEKEHEI